MRTIYNVETPENAETSLSGMLDWEWHGDANYKDMCKYVWQSASGELIGCRELKYIVSEYIVSTHGNLSDYDLNF